MAHGNARSRLHGIDKIPLEARNAVRLAPRQRVLTLGTLQDDPLWSEPANRRVDHGNRIVRRVHEPGRPDQFHEIRLQPGRIGHGQGDMIHPVQQQHEAGPRQQHTGILHQRRIGTRFHERDFDADR